jgi:tetratricopeptide (TPR) repeat protein
LHIEISVRRTTGAIPRRRLPGSRFREINSAAMNGSVEPQPPEERSGIPTFGTRIRSDESWLDHPAVHDFSHTRTARFGCAALAIGVLVVLGMIVVPVVNSIRSANRAEDAIAKADRELKAQKFPAAIASYTAALGERLRTSDRAIAYGNRGWFYTKIQRDAEAIRDFSSALQIEPKLLFARLDRGLAYHRAGRFTEALADYDKTIALDPNALDAYANRSSIYALSGRLPEAIADLSEAIRCDPDNPRWYGERGDLYLRNGELETARASYETAIRLYPEYADAYWGLGKVFRREGKPERGLAVVNDAIRLHPKSAALYFGRGLIQMDAQVLDLSQKDFDRAILLQPRFAMAYANRAWIEFWLGRPDAALGYASRAVDLNSQKAAPYYVRGRAYDEEAEYTNAVAEFDKAIALSSEFIWAVVWRTMAEAHSGACALARRDLEDATNRFPGLYQSHLMRAWFLATCPNATFATDR